MFKKELRFDPVGKETKNHFFITNEKPDKKEHIPKSCLPSYKQNIKNLQRY